MVEPLSGPDAKKLIRIIVANGGVAFSGHARNRMTQHSMGELDAVNALRSGIVEMSELESGTWRYRVRTHKFVVVVAFRSETELRVVTAWRIK